MSSSYNRNGKNGVPCDMCPKWCFSKTELLIHKTMHTGRIYKCHLCDKKFCFTEVLREHWQRSHGITTIATVKCCEEKDKCRSSLKPYRLQSLFVPVASLLNGKYVYQCEICPEVTHTVSEFHAHMVNHVGKHPFACETCAMSFNDVESLECHLSSHAEELKLKCPFCVKVFHLKSNVVLHLSHTHATNQYYDCIFCSQIFATSKELSEHPCVKNIS